MWYWSGWQDYLSGDPENRIVTQHYPIQATPGAFFSFDSSQILRFVAIKQKNPTTFVIGLSWSGWQDSNLRPPAPKAGAMTGLRYTPSYL